jgi:phosphohistidine phosphatase
LLRHAKSDWETGALSDFDRPLAKRGRKEAPGVGEWLLEESLVPDLLISSTAERAKETALLVGEAMDYKKKHILWDENIYMAEVPALLGVLADCPTKTRAVMLIGHNPGLEELMRYLLGAEVETPPDGKLLPTATVARLEMPKDWHKLESGCAKLLGLRRPRREA